MLLTIALAACAAPIEPPAPTLSPRQAINSAGIASFTRAAGQYQLVMFYSPL
ncbi:MAG TPA: hypothetical protein VFF59_11580 [Anaerolineae bacterium]|nr:hypothetical protein [Anaerolineae bacterium]